MSLPGSRQVADPAAAYLIADMLSDNFARALAFGAESPLRFGFPVACKTGTSSDFRDNWAFGYTPEFTVGIWVGNFDGTPMEHVSGVTGAAPILHDLFEHLHQRYGTTWYAAPANIVECWVHPITGKRLSRTHEGRARWDSAPWEIEQTRMFSDARGALGQRALPAGRGWVTRPDAGGYAPDPARPFAEAIKEKFAADNLPPLESSTAPSSVQLGSEYRDWLASGDNWLGNRAVLAPGKNSLRILFPLPGTTIYLDRDLPQQGRRISLRAEGPEHLEWQSDSLRVARDGSLQVALLTEGHHQITVRDPVTGDGAQTWINVLAR